MDEQNEKNEQLNESASPVQTETQFEPPLDSISADDADVAVVAPVPAPVKAELPKWWRLDDKIPSDRKPTDAEKAQAGKVFGAQRGVFGRDARLFNILALVILAVAVLTAVISLFAPVYGMYDKVDNGAFIVDTQDGTIIKGHYIKVNQSGVKFLAGLISFIQHDDNKIEEKQREHERALSAIQSEYGQWVAQNPSAATKDAQKAYERIFKSEMSKTDYVGYVVAQTQKKLLNGDSSSPNDFISIFVLSFLLIVESVVYFIMAIIFATKIITEITNRSDRIMYWHAFTLPGATIMFIYFGAICGYSVNWIFLLFPTLILFATSISIGVIYAKHHGKLNKSLIIKSAISPVLVLVGFALMVGTDFITVHSGNIRYGAAVGDPVIEILTKLFGKTSSNTLLFAGIGLLAVSMIILVVVQRKMKKREALNVEAPMMSASGYFASLNSSFIFIPLICLIIGAFTETSVKFHINAVQYIAAVLLLAPSVYERIVKNVDYRKRLKAAQEARSREIYNNALKK